MQVNIPLIHDTSLEAIELEDIDIQIALKNFTLFSIYKDEVCAISSKKYLVQSSNFLSKLEKKYTTIFLDEESYEKLYNKYLEQRTEKNISSLEEASEDEELSQSEDELSLTEFLRNTEDILSSEESAPIIKFVNSLFYQAIKKKASDIHIESQENKGEVRFRIDGVMSKHANLDKNIINLIISRIKVISNLDISEKRIPQDGRTAIKISGKTLDIRVSILPTFYGERVVMRILMQSEDIPSMQELGFSKNLVKSFNKLLTAPHGIILVTGPTGSGKSTTLHSFLQEVASPSKNIITVEDPVEYKTDNISQIQVNSKVGLSFASGLRSILRQDPDVIMIGEIRDSETADIAIQSALTGHLVFSTLHTNNASSSIARLKDMGIETFLINSSLIAVLAQRLVRKLCDNCKEEDILAENFAKDFKLEKKSKIYKAGSCASCSYTGYSGRVAIGELFILDDFIKDIVKETTDDHIIRKACVKRGFKTLQAELKELLILGKTSLQEALRLGLKDE